MFGLANESEVEAIMKVLDTKINQLAQKEQEDIIQLSKAFSAIQNQNNNQKVEEVSQRLDLLESYLEENRKAIIKLIDLMKTISKDKKEEVIVEKPKTLNDKIADIKNELVLEEEPTYTSHCLKCRKENIIVDPENSVTASGRAAIIGTCIDCGSPLIKPGVKIK